MNFLIMTGPLYPKPGNNANLIGKLIPQLLENKHAVKLFSSAFEVNQSELPQSLFGVPVYWSVDDKKDLQRKILFPLISKLKDPNGFSDELKVQVYLHVLSKIRSEYPFDVVLTTSEPYAMAVAATRLTNVKKILYLMDPPALISHGHNTPYRSKTLKKTLQLQDYIISTPFIFDALDENGIEIIKEKRITTGFPMIQSHSVHGHQRNDNKIRLLFTGWLYSDIRSPEYFLNIVEKLDDRFEIVFMGKECDLLKERFSIKTDAELITLPQQPYEVALHAMNEADILINIGNSVPVHMPSKTLEYINTGKPIVNFYKIEYCPTLYYTSRYPLALNLFEGDQQIDQTAETFIHFCESSKGQVVDRDYILSEYKDCTPEHIANKILDVLE